MSVWWKQAKWWLIAATAIGFAVLAFCLRGLFDSPGRNPKPGDGGFLPPPPKPLQEAADRAAEEALKAKAASKAVTDAKKQELETITKVEDGKERRKQLAAFLQTL